MWLTLSAPIRPVVLRLGSHEFPVQGAEWFWEVRRHMEDKIQFLYFFMCFLSNHGRSVNVFVGSAISTAHFAQVCTQRVLRDILVLDHPFGSENWRYVRSTTPYALLDNILNRLLVHLCDVMDLLFPAFGPYETSSELAIEIIVQKIKVSQTPISSSLGPLNRNIFIRRTKMRIDDLVGASVFTGCRTQWIEVTPEVRVVEVLH